MFKKFLYFFILPLVASSLQAQEKVPALQQMRAKEDIADLQKRIAAAGREQKSRLLVDLALAYERDQDLEKAFKVYLEALDMTVPKKPLTVTPEEQKLYDEALATYLGHNSGAGALETGKQILEQYGPLLEKKPDNYLLGFLIAAAYANFGLFDHFFEQFYESYQRYPDSHMALRTKAVLHIKLYEKARLATERESQRKAIFELANKAVQVNPNDSSLYKLMMTFSLENEKPRVVKESIEKLIAQDVQVPRADILFYVSAAMETKQKELAQQFLDKAKSWYPYSRVMNSAQELIK